MEQSNAGVIAFSESRENVEAMIDAYRNEYLGILHEQDETNREYRRNKWKLKIGHFFASELVFCYTPFDVSIIGGFFESIGNAITQIVMKIKNKIDNRKYEKKKKKLEADFVNGEGIFQSYTAYNNTEFERVEESDLVNDNKNGYHM